MKSNDYKRLNSHGPGGRKCGCCFPINGKGHKLAKRQDEHKVRRFFDVQLKKEINGSIEGTN